MFVFVKESENNLVFFYKVSVFLGVENLVVIDIKDVFLIVYKDKVKDLKVLVNEVEINN